MSDIITRHRRTLELLPFAAAGPAGGALLLGGDPLGAGSGVSWALLPPVILAARYGSARGIACAALAALFAALLGSPASTLVPSAVGAVLLAGLVGEIAATRERRLGRYRGERDYLRERLDRFAVDHHVLRASHARLEECVAGQTTSLRQALQSVQATLGRDEGGEVRGAETLMALLARHFSVRSAALYLTRSSRELEVQPAATLGAPDGLSSFDPMVQHALCERELVAIDAERQGSVEPAALALVPLVDAHDRLHGLLAIGDIHFTAFHQGTLDVLALLGRSVGDALGGLQPGGATTRARFVAELERAAALRRDHDIPATLIRVATDDGRALDTELLQALREAPRGLDLVWTPEAGASALAILMPMSTEEQARGFLARVVRAEALTARDGAALLDAAHLRPVTSHDDGESLLRFALDGVRETEATGTDHRHARSLAGALRRVGIAPARTRLPALPEPEATRASGGRPHG